jgi:phosphatidylglycerophosphatase A
MTSDQPDSGNRRTEVPFLTRLVATGLFVGYIPWASGTFGSLVGVLFYLIPGADDPPVLVAMILAGMVVGTTAAYRVAKAEGNRLAGTAEITKRLFQPGSTHSADPSIVVIDEIVGMWISLLWLPKTVIAIALAFVLFRIMDVLKPEPAQMMERLPYGFGIMLDDVIAGIYANLASHTILYILTITIHSF